jgi:hypothetical protein
MPGKVRFIAVFTSLCRDVMVEVRSRTREAEKPRVSKRRKVLKEGRKEGDLKEVRRGHYENAFSYQDSVA